MALPKGVAVEEDEVVVHVPLNLELDLTGAPGMCVNLDEHYFLTTAGGAFLFLRYPESEP